MRAWDAMVGVAVLGLSAFLVTGCSNNTTGVGTAGTTITVTFVGGTPLAVANQIGTGSFTAMTPGSRVSFSVPSGTSKYAIAFVCPPVVTTTTTLNPEFVIEATIQDTTSFTANCLSSPSLAIVTGSASSSLSGTASIRIRGAQGFGADIAAPSGPFPSSPATQFPVGTNDVAAIAVDGSGNVLGVQFVRSQTVPGTINGGSGIVIVNPNTPQSFSVTSLPGVGFANPPEASVEYHTANGTRFLLTNSSASSTNPEPYQAVPTTEAQTGDFYRYESNTSNTTTNQSLGITTTTSSGGGTFSVALPVPWSFSGPTPAKFPTFTFIYSGFSGLPAVSDQASIQWATGATTSNQITVLATANFQNGATTITIPDLTSLAGFLTPAATGTTINWVGDIFGGTTQEFIFSTNPPANASVSFVQNRGMFTQP